MTDKTHRPERLFTDPPLNRLSMPYPERIAEKIRNKKWNEAISECEEMRGSQILLHDFFADACTLMWSWVGEHLGEDTIDPMFRHIFFHSAKRQYFDAARANVMPHLTIELLARSWRAHSCYGAGDDPGAFSITEDDEKFTFHLSPCGSGARLWRRGWYEDSMGGKISEKKHTWTYQRKGFPYYCIHCAFLNEILPYESEYGFPLWPVDPISNKEGKCAWHIYKNPEMIPDHYYTRFDFVPKKSKKPVKTKSRFFSDKALAEMSRPMPERITEHLQNREHRAALKLCREVEGEFLALHDLYVMMLSSTLTYIAEQKGEETLGDLLELEYEKCIKKPILNKLKNKTVKEKTAFLAHMIFGTDNCEQTGYHAGKFSVKEDNLYIYFVLDPCGSGGRLLRAGSYEPMPFFKKIQEQTENVLAGFAAHSLHLPEKLMKRIVPFAVTHFTQRKPYLQGRTKAAHTWSFNKKNVPFYCCQCGMIQKKLGDSCLEIIPPGNKKETCLWRLKKQDENINC